MKTNPYLSVLLSFATVLEVVAAPETPNGFQLQTKLVDANGQPLPGAAAALYRESDLERSDATTPPALARATANENGTVTFTVTNQTSYTLVASQPGLSWGWAAWYPQPDQEDGASEIALTAPAAVSGVVNDAGGNPIPDAEVWVSSAQIPSKRGGSFRVSPLQRLAGRAFMATRTSSDGKFRIGQIPAEATLDLAASKPGLALERQSSSRMAGTTFKYLAGESNIVLTLKPTGAVEGSVLEEDTGKPVAGVRVWPVRARTSVGINPLSLLPTGADGIFHVANLAEGDYDFRAMIGTNPFPELVCEPVTATVVAGATNRNVKISASRGGVIEIIARNPAGQPVKDAEVSAMVQNRGGGAQTSDSGIARMRLPPGNYTLYVTQRGGRAFQSQITCEKGVTNRQEVTLEQVPMISGTVRDPGGQPAPKVRLTLFPFGGEKVTDSQGRFAIACEPARTSAMGNIQSVLIFRDTARNLAATLDVDEDTTNASVRLEPALTLAGRVTDPGGRAVTNAEFQVVFHTERMGTSLSQPVAAGADGRFQVGALPTGRHYGLTVTAKGYGMETRDLGTLEPPMRKLDLDPFQLPVADRRIAGVVVDEEGKPVTGVRISSYGTGQARISGQTDSRGRFTFDQVCAGAINLSANAGTSHGTVVAEGGDTNITLKLSAISSGRSFPTMSAAPKLSGTVVNPEGRPAPKVLVSLLPDSPDEKPTDAEGRFKLSADSPQFGGGQPEPRVLIARDLTRNLAAALDLEAGATNAGLKLEPAWALAGRAVDPNGAAIPGAQAQPMLKTDRMMSGFGSPARANAEGRFEIKGLPQGRRFSVRISAKGFGQDTTEAEPPEGDARRVELDPTQLLVADRRIAGVVLDADDKPVANAYVSGSGNRQPYVNGQTDLQGRFAFKQVCAGPIQLAVSSQRGLYGNATVEGGDTNITLRIAAPQARRGRTPPPPVASLQGKPLPDLTPLGLTGDDVPAKQPILAVLIDAEQRPSRRVLKRLTELADTLKQKGLTVVVLQAGALEGADFTTWKQEMAIPFPVGVFKGNRDQARAAWGAATLPWLILTDAHRKVIDEGFAPGELEEKLNLADK